MSDDDTMTSKEALFALETTMEEDMATYGQEVTMLAIKHINSTPELYNLVKKDKGVSANVAHECRLWAERHDDEFGELFISELEAVDWPEVARRI